MDPSEVKINKDIRRYFDLDARRSMDYGHGKNIDDIIDELCEWLAPQIDNIEEHKDFGSRAYKYLKAKYKKPEDY